METTPVPMGPRPVPPTPPPPAAGSPPGVVKPTLTFLYLIRNLMSLMGLAGMAFFGLLLLFLVALDLAGVFREESLYSGLVTYVVLPVVFTLSVMFTAAGMLWKWRRTRKRGFEGALVPGQTRRGRILAITTAVAITVGWIAVVCFGTYKGYHYTDSTAFCGLACHQIMEPEYTAYKRSVHARVNCVECHIGPGADWFVKAKFTGLKQVWATYRGTYHTPIQTPLHSLRPAQDTCEHCHWPGRFTGSVERVITHYAADEENTPNRLNLLMKVGGGYAAQGQPGGAHWHVSGDWTVQYLPLDEKRQDLPYARVTYKDGRVEEFARPDFNRAELVEGNLRVMDCLDCHSRPSHVFKSPNRALDEALDNGLVSPTLPGIKRLAFQAFSQQYQTKDEALTAIDAALDAYVQARKFTPAQQDLMREARFNLKRVYSSNFFPEHGVDYRAFVDNLGHFEFKGCERCHDGKHQSLNGGKVISKDCNACHLIIAQASGAEELKTPNYKLSAFKHPEEPVNLKRNCSSCHALDQAGPKKSGE